AMTTADPNGLLTLPVRAGGWPGTGLPVSLTVTDSSNVAQVVTYNTTIPMVNQLPTGVSTDGPYTLNFGETKAMTAFANPDANACNTLSYNWDMNNDGVFDYTSTANPKRSIQYAILQPWLAASAATAGTGPDYTITLQVTDSSGGVTTATTILTLSTIPPVVAAPASITVPATSSTGNYTVSWATSTTVGATYILEEFDGVNTTQYSSPTYSYEFTGKANGNYTYRVQAVKLNSPMTASAWTAVANCTVAYPLTAVTFTANPSTSQAVGQPVHIVATPTGGGVTIQYKLFFYDYNGTKPGWKTAVDWQQNATFDWDTSTASGAGSYLLMLQARNLGSQVIVSAPGKGYTLYNMSEVTAVTFTANPSTSQNVGQPVSIVATPTGGGPTIEYKLLFYDYNGTTPSWKTAVNWQQSKTFNWDTSTASGAGSYSLIVEARTFGSLVTAQSPARSYTLANYSEVTAVTFTANPSTSQTAGQPVSIVATPTGGEVTIQYKLLFYDYNGTTPGWKTAVNWQENATFDWDTSTASGAGSYLLLVQARNLGSLIQAQSPGKAYTLN
ncbi:MAG: hypothetical protein ACSLFH_07720, partial [Desulfuromonadales bacterium]